MTAVCIPAWCVISARKGRDDRLPAADIPWRSRFIGPAAARSVRISWAATRCPSVSLNGSVATNRRASSMS